MKIKLTPRLYAVADFVRSGSKLADIGTDHAYLPVFLCTEGIINSAIAADIVQGPLGKARETVERYGMTDKIELVLTDGLVGIDSEQIDDIVIAGMGGELISSIILSADWLKNPRKRLILQPMSKESTLRDTLYSNGFEIKYEATVDEGRHIYTVICAEFAGKIYLPTDAELLLGKIDTQTQAGRKYLEREIRRLESRIKGKFSDEQNKKNNELINFLKSL